MTAEEWKAQEDKREIIRMVQRMNQKQREALAVIMQEEINKQAIRDGYYDESAAGAVFEITLN